MPNRSRTLRDANIWDVAVATVPGRFYIYPVDEGLYRAITATTGVPPTGATDANYTLWPETPQYSSSVQGKSNGWKWAEADWAAWKVVKQMQQWIADNFQWAAYASMDDPATGITDLGIGWTPVTTYASDLITPRGITTDLVNGTMAFQADGIYRLAVTLNMAGHDSVNDGRSSGIRLYNVTDGLPGAQLVYGIGRNVEDTYINSGGLVEITDAQKGKAFRIELGGGDAIASIDQMAVNFEAWSVSEFREPLPDVLG